MRTVLVGCRPSEMRRVKITCRCGRIFIAEIPPQIARARSLHPCPGCSAPFLIQQQVDGKWSIERMAESMDEAVFADVHETSPEEQEYKQKGYIVGLRIKIVNRGRNGEVLTSSHPEHVGKFGMIVGERDFGVGQMIPLIRLDDGSQLTGMDCWWEPVTQ